MRLAKRPKIQPYYWSLWAVSQAGSMPRIGFPTQVPFYQPARLSKVEAVSGDIARHPATLDDWRIVERIAELVTAHRMVRPREVWALEVCEGAYLGASPDLKKRCAENRISVSTCQRMASRARWAVDSLY